MFKKIKTILCHPSAIGIYFLDRWYTVLGVWFGFFLVTVLLFTLRDLSTRRFTTNYSNSVAEVLYDADALATLEYKDDSFNDVNTKIDTNYALVYFNQTGSLNTLTEMNVVLVLGTNKASVYYGLIELGSIEYSSLNIEDFSMAEAKSGNVEARLYFYRLISNVFDSGDSKFRTVCLLNDLLNFLFFYFIALVVAYFTGFVLNPGIERKIRFKLSCYDTMIYFVLTWITVLYSAAWVEYISFVFPLIFAGLTFSHIRRITVRRRRM